MSASNSLNPQLFHGTTHWFKPGEIVRAGRDVFYPEDPGAYATTSMNSAKIFARGRLEHEEVRDPSENKQLALFAPIFPVEHVSEHEDPKNKLTNKKNSSYRRDMQGFRVTGPPVDYIQRYYQHELR